MRTKLKWRRDKRETCFFFFFVNLALVIEMRAILLSIISTYVYILIGFLVDQ